MLITFFLPLLFIQAANADSSTVFLDKLTLPEGFKVEVFAEVPFARSLDITKNENVVVAEYNFAGISGNSTIYSRVWAVPTTKSGSKSQQPVAISEKLYVPNGIAVASDKLFVAQIDTLLEFGNIDDRISKAQNGEKLQPGVELLGPTTLPSNKWHGWRYLISNKTLSTEDKSRLYLAIGAPCNVPEGEQSDCLTSNSLYGTIQAVDITRKGGEVSVKLTPVAQGVRNSVGLAIHPTTKQLWFTENGRDSWSSPVPGNLPPDEINRVVSVPMPGQEATNVPHFGFPYCYGKGLVDPQFNSRDCSNYTAAIAELQPHVAALGLRFYTGDQFPEVYKNQIFFAEHGSWNRQPPSGYRVARVKLSPDQNDIVEYDTFLGGFLPNPPIECKIDNDCPGTSHCQTGSAYKKGPFYCSGWGRPADVLVMPDGAMLVSDEQNGVIYRVYYSEPVSRWITVGLPILLVSLLVGSLSLYALKEIKQAKSSASYSEIEDRV